MAATRDLISNAAILVIVSMGLSMVVLEVAVIGPSLLWGRGTQTYENSYQEQCHGSHLIMISHNLTGNSVFTTWYNCKDGAVLFVLKGEGNALANDPLYHQRIRLDITPQTALTAPGHGTVTATSTLQAAGRVEEIEFLLIYTTDYPSESTVLSPVYQVAEPSVPNP